MNYFWKKGKLLTKYYLHNIKIIITSLYPHKTNIFFVYYNYMRLASLYLLGCRMCIALPKKRPYSEFFCSVFARIRAEYGRISRISTYLRTRKTSDMDTFHTVLIPSKVGKICNPLKTSTNIFLLKFNY